MSGHVRAAHRVHRNAANIIAITASQIGAVDQAIASRVQLGHEGVLIVCSMSPHFVSTINLPSVSTGVSSVPS